VEGDVTIIEAGKSDSPNSLRNAEDDGTTHTTIKHPVSNT
jgi:hypothetical protein